MRTSVRTIVLALGLVGLGLTGLAACTPAITFATSDCAADAGHPEAPCGSLAAKIESLQPGDTLEIKPGTYDIGYSRLNDIHGTADKPITITASDPSQPPTLTGWLSLWSAQYVTLDHLRLQATWSASSHGGPAGALSYMCGVGWRVQNSEIFGADHTQAVWNLLINGKKAASAPSASSAPSSECPGQPVGFVVSGNVFHNSYVPPTCTGDPKWHHIYANFEGDADTGGTISRNLFVGNRCGAGIKLGTGDQTQPRGARNVRIEYNTFYDGARAILLQNDIRGTTIVRNLTDRIVFPYNINRSIPVALGTVTAATPPNTIAHTFAANNLNQNGRVWGPVQSNGIGVLSDLCDNKFRSGDDPQWNSTDYTVANSFTPANATASKYGRFGHGTTACN
jgi:hypothetical protein